VFTAWKFCLFVLQGTRVEFVELYHQEVACPVTMEVDDECVQHPAIYVEVEYRSGPEVLVPKNELGQAGATGIADPPARDSLVCTVKVECPQGHVSTETRSLSTKIGALKTHLAQLVDLSPDVLTLSFQNQLVTDDQTLDHFAKPHDSINFTLTSKDPSMHPIRLNPSGHLLLPVPDVITVRVKDSKSDQCFIGT